MHGNTVFILKNDISPPKKKTLKLWGLGEKIYIPDKYFAAYIGQNAAALKQQAMLKHKGRSMQICVTLGLHFFPMMSTCDSRKTNHLQVAWGSLCKMDACVEDGRLKPRSELVQDWGCLVEKVSLSACCRSKVDCWASVHSVNHPRVQSVRMNKLKFGPFLG